MAWNRIAQLVRWYRNSNCNSKWWVIWFQLVNEQSSHGFTSSPAHLLPLATNQKHASWQPRFLGPDNLRRRSSAYRDRVSGALAALCICFFLSISPLCGQSAAEVVSSDNEFQIRRQLARMALTEADAKKKSFFFDVGGLVERTTLPSDEASEVGRTATELLGSQFRLVSSKAEASYLIQIRVDRLTDYAIRNPKREPARGLVMISLCRWPIVDVGADCGNLVFYRFGAFRGVEALKKAFPMWLSMTLQSPR